MKRFLPHLTASLAVCMMVVTYIDDRNPMMGFLRSTVGKVYLFALCALSLTTAIFLIRENRKRKPRTVSKPAGVKTSRKIVTVNGEKALMEVTLTPLKGTAAPNQPENLVNSEDKIQ